MPAAGSSALPGCRCDLELDGGWQAGQGPRRLVGSGCLQLPPTRARRGRVTRDGQLSPWPWEEREGRVWAAERGSWAGLPTLLHAELCWGRTTPGPGLSL